MVLTPTGGQFLTTGATAALVEEAIHVFHLNHALLTAIRGPVRRPLSPSTDVPPTPSTLVPPVLTPYPPTTTVSTRSLPLTAAPPSTVPWIIVMSVGFTIWWFGSLAPLPQAAIDAWAWTVDRVTADLR